jgi:predicted unusual protein kinase regulating ubiquinone biosynthesis (AarF/ABC1/UbiB family)
MQKKETEKKTLKGLRTNLFSRGLSLAKTSFKAGSLAAGQWLNRGGGGGERDSAWLAKMELLVQELGKLKGTAMKVGQTLSIYGEHLLPKEVNELLKNLQQNSPPLAWEKISAVLTQELGAEKLSELEVEHAPVASASIGQVHRARVRSTGETLALKIQYPGVDKAIETDLKLLKFIFGVYDLVPRGTRLDQIFAEIRDMFHQEIDYSIELKAACAFGKRLKEDSRYIVPDVFPRYSSSKVLAYQFIEGHRADAPEVQALSQERRNRLGQAYLELYLRELLEFHEVQTDPHLGNYRIQIDPGGANDRLVLFDFGAVRGIPAPFLKDYFAVIEGAIHRDARSVEKAGRGLGLLQPEDSLGLVDDYVQLTFLITEPFDEAQDEYDWGQSDLPQRVAKQAAKIATSYHLRAPPRELIFLDRKLGGVFVFLSVLKCKMAFRKQVLGALEASPRRVPDLYE